MPVTKSGPVLAICTFALAACRLAGPEDLVGGVPAHAGAADAGVAALGAPEEVPSAPRLHAATCAAPAPPSPSVMVDVPAGPFPMGCSPTNDLECKADESPAHAVVLAAFRLDATEVTQAHRPRPSGRRLHAATRG